MGNAPLLSSGNRPIRRRPLSNCAWSTHRRSGVTATDSSREKRSLRDGQTPAKQEPMSNGRYGGEAPIAVAIKRGSYELVRLLIDHGANLRISFDVYRGDDDAARWVIDLVEYADRCMETRIAKLLRDAGAGSKQGQAPQRPQGES